MTPSEMMQEKEKLLLEFERWKASQQEPIFSPFYGEMGVGVKFREGAWFDLWVSNLENEKKIAELEEELRRWKGAACCMAVMDSWIAKQAGLVETETGDWKLASESKESKL
jgi:hypothetical protein